jgi:trans-2-enoyl-CoA reductase
MRAIQFSRFGIPDQVAEFIDLKDATPGPGEIAAELLCSPINPADLLYMRGEYGVVPQLPAAAGFEGIGRVAAVGAGVTNVAVGDRVLLSGGVWRDRAIVPAAALFPLPADVPAEQLAMLTINPLTARAMLAEAALSPGEFVIKNAANSGVGRVFFGLARRAGLHGIAVVRRPGLEDTLRGWGAEHVLVDGPDLATRVRAIVGGGKLRFGVDAVGGAATARLGASLSPGGVVVNYGLLSGEPCQVAAGDLIFRSITVRGFWLVQWFRATPPAQVAAAYGELIALLRQGELTTPVEATYPLSRIQDALKHAAQGGRDGKVILRAG